MSYTDKVDKMRDRAVLFLRIFAVCFVVSIIIMVVWVYSALSFSWIFVWGSLHAVGLYGSAYNISTIWFIDKKRAEFAKEDE
jgi:membrane protein YdbS with pleckstrin-like domain